MPVSQKLTDSNKELSDLVKQKAINICENKIWSGLFGIGFSDIPQNKLLLS